MGRRLHRDDESAHAALFDGALPADLILPVILVQMVTAYVFFDRHWGRVVTALSAALGGEIAMVAAKLEETPDREEWIALQAILNLDLDITYEPGATLREGNQIDAD